VPEVLVAVGVDVEVCCDDEDDEDNEDDGVVVAVAAASADDVATVVGGSGALATGTFCSVSKAVAFSQPFSLPSNMHKSSSLFPPAMTTNPLGSPANA
jgi:hypothetical protein